MKFVLRALFVEQKTLLTSSSRAILVLSSLQYISTSVVTNCIKFTIANIIFMTKYFEK